MADVKDPKKLTDKIAREENESDKKAMKKVLGAAAAVPAGLAGLAMSAHPDFPGPIDSARLSGKMAYKYVTGDQKGLEDADKEFVDRARARKNIERKGDTSENTNPAGDTYKRGGKVSSASKRADGCAQRGKTKGRMV